MMTDVDIIGRSMEKTHIWLNELAESSASRSPGRLPVLRAYLHALRDRLIVNEAAQLPLSCPS